MLFELLVGIFPKFPPLYHIAFISSLSYIIQYSTISWLLYSQDFSRYISRPSSGVSFLMSFTLLAFMCFLVLILISYRSLYLPFFFRLLFYILRHSDLDIHLSNYIHTLSVVITSYGYSDANLGCYNHIVLTDLTTCLLQVSDILIINFHGILIRNLLFREMDCSHLALDFCRR